MCVCVCVCAACQCNGHSDYCSEDGTCMNCTSNTAGGHCELCAADFYNHTSSGCVACDCHPSGSLNSTCNMTTGQCQCAMNVSKTSRTCDQCVDGYYNISNCQREYLVNSILVVLLIFL